ncbi:hypothetical protein R3W88_030664 [Solanum pinnatisectum]|uniref:Uncharacterized protein n=1 Tax=Solanum pinnatisectum TaxID=50273 RepID=A0AAV9LKE0_9SOLN|nr:hypothetical protein R3W88_030664 [Solanum pinnatisectum]
MVHGIMEIFEQEHEGVRWLIMGDDDSIFFLENLVDVLAKYDHNKYYYFGVASERYGGAGFIMSFPLAKALAKDIESCLRRYPFLKSAQHITMACIVDLGVSFSPRGLLSSYPKAPLMSLHHFDAITPIFPSMDRTQSIEHFMKPAKSHLIIPIQTFRTWIKTPKPPHYIFNMRSSGKDSCETPHIFFLKSVREIWNKNEIQTTYFRSMMRWLPDCPIDGNHPANYVNKIQVYSPKTKRIEIDRCECCDIIHKTGSNKAKIKLRECFTNEKIA